VEVRVLFRAPNQTGYRCKIKHSDAVYFNQSFNDAAIAAAKRVKPSPALEEVHRVIDGMKAGTPFEKRSRAIIALALLTGAGDDANASMSLGHVDLNERVVFQVELAPSHPYLAIHNNLQHAAPQGIKTSGATHVGSRHTSLDARVSY
jgi:hypothetical protein